MRCALSAVLEGSDLRIRCSSSSAGSSPVPASAGGYAAINSAIDELIPARIRGRIDLIINGLFWLGTAFETALSVFLLNESFFAKALGWRLAFGSGEVVGLVVLLVRRNAPESPLWMFTHGRRTRPRSPPTRAVGGASRRTWASASARASAWRDSANDDHGQPRALGPWVSQFVGHAFL